MSKIIKGTNHKFKNISYQVIEDIEYNIENKYNLYFITIIGIDASGSVLMKSDANEQALNILLYLYDILIIKEIRPKYIKNIDYIIEFLNKKIKRV